MNELMPDGPAPSGILLALDVSLQERLIDGIP